jgi:hypothetical protein
MANLPPGVPVHFLPAELALLRFRPPADAALFIAVHREALRAMQNRLTQVVGMTGSGIVWTGAVDERMIEVTHGVPQPDVRATLADYLLVGPDVWSIVAPGPLLIGHDAHLTVYHRSRPWVVVGELSSDVLLGMPLNDAGGPPKWFSPVIPQTYLRLPTVKDGRLELAHLWSIPRVRTKPLGEVTPEPRDELELAIRRYFA